MKIGIIDYGAGNIQSVVNALEKIKQKWALIKSPSELQDCDKLILPGVGAAASAMVSLKSIGLDDAILANKKPMLGICLGLQLMTTYSEEGDTVCLDIISGRILEFPSLVKLPQVGWNRVSKFRESYLLEGIDDDEYFYFVNSYYLDSGNDACVAKSMYGVSFASVVQMDNFYGVQFHPEKSGKQGLKLLSNFCELC